MVAEGGFHSRIWGHIAGRRDRIVLGPPSFYGVLHDQPSVSRLEYTFWFAAICSDKRLRLLAWIGPSARDGSAEFEAIRDNVDAPTFANTVDALELMGGDLEKVLGPFYALAGTDFERKTRRVAA